LLVRSCATALPPVDGIEYDFDLGVDFGSGPSNGVHYKFILYMDHAIWCYLMIKKDLHPEMVPSIARV